ncbi:hypothetical protein YA163_05990 [Tetragenococcus halophilus]|nr:hypothetical protein YA163_05990 [Tetragenococcus halophilus]
MNTAAIYHRPESEFAYLYEKETLHLRLRTAKSDISSVQVVGGDPYLVEKGQRETPIDMVKILSTDLHDYWFASVKAPFKRLSYGFVLTSEDHVQVFYGDQGLFLYQKMFWVLPTYTFAYLIFMKSIALKPLNGQRKLFGIKFFLNALLMVINQMIQKERFVGDRKFLDVRIILAATYKVLLIIWIM